MCVSRVPAILASTALAALYCLQQGGAAHPQSDDIDDRERVKKMLANIEVQAKVDVNPQP